LPIPSQVVGDIPPGFDAWFAKALTREPEGRFASATELAESLGAVCGLPVRGSYSTADIPIPSFASGPRAISSPAITPGPGGMTPPGIMPVTPYPTADRTGKNPVFSHSATSASTMQMAATGAPTTQTPAPSTSRNTGAIIAVAAAAVIVLAIGGAVLLKTLGGSDEHGAATPSAAETVAQVTAPAGAPPLRPPAVPGADQPVPQLAPPPTASVAPLGAAKPTARPQPAHPVGKPGPKPKPAGPTPGGADVGF
jgi:serine/threonine-protein kinase